MRLTVGEVGLPSHCRIGTLKLGLVAVHANDCEVEGEDVGPDAGQAEQDQHHDDEAGPRAEQADVSSLRSSLRGEYSVGHVAERF